MRRIVAVLCVALGVCAVVVAPLSRFVIAETLMLTPMDYYRVLVSAGDMTYFNIEEVAEADDISEVGPVEGAPVEATTTLRADVAASTDDTVVWDEFTAVVDTNRDFHINYNDRRVGHDRRTGEAVDCCDATVNSEAVVQTGQAYKFPFFVEQRDYEFYDTFSQQALPIRFDGVETIQGVETYRFVQEIPETKIGEREMPAPLLGLDEDEGDVVADEMYSNTRTYWIEPITGSPIDQMQEQHRYATAEGGEDLTLFSGTLRFTDETVAEGIEFSDEGRAVLPLLRTTVPLAALVAGVLLIVLGILLYMSTRRQPEHRRTA